MKRLIACVAIIILIGVAGVWQTRTSNGTVVIVSGNSIGSVAEKLAADGIVKSATAFKIAYVVHGDDAPVHPGLVEFNDCSLACIVRQVTSLERRTVRFTLTEGESLRDFAARIEKKNIGTGKQLYTLVGTPAQTPTTRTIANSQHDFLHDAPRQISLEGYLFPDTYEITEAGGVDALVADMLKNFDKKFTPALRARAAAQGHTIHDVVTLASILEREVRGVEDRQKVADILWRRLDKGMGLQVDASVNYVTGKSNLFTTAADRATDSLWNTYKYRGLPLGPIGNPGIETIEAALSRTPNDNWYYLTSPKGDVYYARTLEEHVANKKYLK